jgi:hypothetical protein
LLKRAKELAPNIATKSGIMVGLGEEFEEVLQVLDDLRAADVDFVTIGQYLQPTLQHHPVARYVHPDEFKRLEKAENDFLKPKGINNKKELEEKLIELTADIDDVIVQKKALSEQENLQEAANIIRDKREQELSLGIRNPSTYKQRAKEFSTTNSDYKGNEYLLILSEKELSKNIGSIELLRETLKYKELTKKAQKKLESKVKARLKSATKKVSKKDTSKGLSFIDKRIMALKLLIKIKGKNDFASKNIKALELAKKFKK